MGTVIMDILLSFYFYEKYKYLESSLNIFEINDISKEKMKLNLRDYR